VRAPVTSFAQQAERLAQAKRRATLLLAAMAVLLAASFVLPPGLFAQALRSTSEAAIVGGLADWFAVAALFRRIPIPLVGRDTDVIARRKDEIGGQLAHFVQQRFLDPDSLAALIRRYNLAAALAAWLGQEANTRRLGAFLVQCVAGSLHLVEAERVQQLLKHATRTALGKVDLSRSAAEVLDTLTADGRHQELLDQTIASLLQVLAAPGTRDAIAQAIVEWLRTQHYRKQLVLPTEWLGSRGSELIAQELARYLDRVRDDPEHRLRTAFDAQVAQLVARLKEDPAMQAHGERIKGYLLDDEDLGRYVAQLWATVSGWLHRNVEDPDSPLHRNLMAAGAWLGRELAGDAELRRTLNAQVEEAARAAAPEISRSLTAHISETVRHWDAHDMAGQVELSIGPQLQKIRINGTLVGGVIGLGLFVAEQVLGRLH
jgi:uncharacterized membrane-anchored protein YjiN (DUF445 family)